MGDMTRHAWRWCSENVRFEQEVPGSKGETYSVRYGRTPTGRYQYGWTCTCKAFKFRGRCKHIEACKPLRCTEGRDAVVGSPTPMGDTCPRCGGSTSVVEVMT